MVAGCTVTTCTCDIWSCGIVNSSALLPWLAGESAGLDFELWHPGKVAAVAITPTTANNLREMLVPVTAGSSSRLLLSSAPMLSYKMPKPGGMLVEPHGSCAPRQDNPTDWQRHAYTRIR